VLSWKLFEILFNKKSPSYKVMACMAWEHPVAGCVNFYSNRKIMAWHMTSVTEYRNLRPVHLLEYSMMLDGIRNNYSWYDMGTDAGNKGLADFKRSFGPEKLMADKIVSWQPAIFNFLRLKDKVGSIRARR
jgi:lipid II:glycine glycyltransferase (peptidoglycan interpeptide bridge formation enzyme)